LDEEYAKIIEEKICNKVEESLNNDGVTLHLQKEKEYKIQEGHQKILEEFELHL
jgi:hypothetical protein